MNSKELKEKYLEFFKAKAHAIIPGSSLIPENDPTALFINSGMHPLVDHFIGIPHPKGKRVADVQKCIRTGDIDEVGDASHLSSFEMLGNWSFGDYFKKEAIEWSYDFIVNVLKLNVNKLSVTVFEGDDDAPKDTESATIWTNLGIPENKIFFLPKVDNWWGPAGETGPCGPNSEMFIDTGKSKCSETCIPGCYCGKYFEIWNDVFLCYNKTKEGTFEKLKQHNVDTGMGVERTIAMLKGYKTVYEIETLKPVIEHIKHIAHIVDPTDDQMKSLRIITDHIRSACFILSDPRAVVPSNTDQGYILRRFIRRSIRHAKKLGITTWFCEEVANAVLKAQNDEDMNAKKDFVFSELKKEEIKFDSTLEKGLREFEKLAATRDQINGKDAFLLFQSYGFPIEMIQELAEEKEISVHVEEFWHEFKQHQELSRKGAEQKFKGGLADNEEETVKLHSATHLLNEALRKVISSDIKQKGSNITPERLRFDFNFDRKMTPEELKKVEACVNEVISRALGVEKMEMPLQKALDMGAQSEFGLKYPDVVSVYKIGDFSLELCGGPHVKNTAELGRFVIKKEESVAAGVRRIKAVVE